MQLHPAIRITVVYSSAALKYCQGCRCCSALCWNARCWNIDLIVCHAIKTTIIEAAIAAVRKRESVVVDSPSLLASESKMRDTHSAKVGCHGSGVGQGDVGCRATHTGVSLQ